jgi:hypothetical protein
MQVKGQLQAPGGFTTGIRVPATRLIGWMGPGAGVDAVAKRKIPIFAPAGNLIPVIYPVV